MVAILRCVRPPKHGHHVDLSLETNNQFYNKYVDRSTLLYLILANETLYALHPNIITIAEDATLYPGLCEPTSQGGLGFDYYVNPRASDMWLSFLEGSISEGRSFAEILFGKTLEQSSIINESLLKDDRTDYIHNWFLCLPKFYGIEFGHLERVEFPTKSNDCSFLLVNQDWDLLATPGVHQDLLSFEKVLCYTTDAQKFILIVAASSVGEELFYCTVVAGALADVFVRGNDLVANAHGLVAL
ncbi:1,4-alpha-glucan-branching enzyme 3, chloroplastic/amyloplastic, partial [Tanacetum coccineum]